MSSTGFFGAVREAFEEKLPRRILAIALFVILIDISAYFNFFGMVWDSDAAMLGLSILIVYGLAFLLLFPICWARLVRVVNDINSCQDNFVGQLRNSLLAFPYLLLMAGLGYYMWNFVRIARITGWVYEFSYWIE